MSTPERIEKVLAKLAFGQPIAFDEWPEETPFAPADLGLAQRDGVYEWLVKPEMIELPLVQVSLAQLELCYFPVIDSTNTRLVESGARTRIANQLYLTEFQYGGRGRRGRNWLSPFARNLAMSLGMGTGRPLPELGGLSLVVGLALADVFETWGVRSLNLKWPNDVLVNGHKLSGILIELVQRGEDLEYVVGMGVNVDITGAERARIDQPVADLRQAGVTHSRTDMVIDIINRVRAYLAHFEEQGFGPFVTAFNDLHIYHGETCVVVQGKQSVTGVVEGVGEQGELLLRTEQGIQPFHGGEVSLRPLTV